MENREKGNTRQKIVQAAIEEFADHGFDGSRVSNIAKRAGVSQSLIYYNFPSKEAILNEILEEFSQSFIEHLSTTYPDDLEASDPVRLRETEFRNSLIYILGKRKEISILLMQALRRGQDNKRMVTVWNEINKKVRAEILSQRGYQANRTQDLNQKVIDYFFIFIPYTMFGVLGDEWIHENGLNVEETNNTLIKVFKGIYDTYLK